MHDWILGGLGADFGIGHKKQVTKMSAGSSNAVFPERSFADPEEPSSLLGSIAASSLVAKAVAEWLARNKSRNHVSRRGR
jgi:hypothetical protein